MSELIGRSSLGSRDAVASRRRVQGKVAARIVDQAARRPAPVRLAQPRVGNSRNGKDLGGEIE